MSLLKPVTEADVERVSQQQQPIRLGTGKMEQLRFESNEAIESAVRVILQEIGEDPQRDGLINTPGRVAKMFAELTAGYKIDPRSVINDAVFEVDYDEMVLVRDIQFYSLCEHHLLPFMGQIHVAYLPDRHVIGLSKIPRIVDMFARRLQVQERLTVQIADFIEQVTEAKGVAVVASGVHMCATMRGVRKETATMMTSALRGLFKTHAPTRAEFMNLIEHDGHK
ncbi:MAG: GTP cyclohydrolase I FolE [Herpetosiphon sp.]